MRLAGKTALVTAAGQGIGRASVLAMAREGAQVLATGASISGGNAHSSERSQAQRPPIHCSVSDARPAVLSTVSFVRPPPSARAAERAHACAGGEA